MSYTTWSTTASLNVTIDGINIGEQCPPQNLNNGLRSVMAGVAELRDDLPDTSGLMPKAGGVFTGALPKYDGAGSIQFNDDPAMIGGRTSYLASGSVFPASPAAGDIVFFYTP